MRIAIDTDPLIPPLTGIGQFTYRLVSAMLPLLQREEALFAFDNGWGTQQLDHSVLDRLSMSGQSLQLSRYLGGKAYIVLRETYAGRQAAWAIKSVARRRSQKNIDLFHAVNYVPSFDFDGPVLPIIYDLSYLRFPSAHPRDRIKWLKSGLNAVAAAPAVQTISEFSKSEIVTLLGVSPDRVHVTYPAPRTCFRLECDADGPCLEKYNVSPRRYFLIVGTREPRKNVKTVAEAFVALPTALQQKYPLLWVGPPGWGDLSLSPWVNKAFEAGRIRLLDYVSDTDLAALYRSTLLFLMPSLYEGFGMPVVEAMACGASVALSKIPVFEEVAGSHARYVEAGDVDGWRRVMNDAVDGEGSAIAGPPQDYLARFSWQVSAAKTLGLYRCLTGKTMSL